MRPKLLAMILALSLATLSVGGCARSKTQDGAEDSFRINVDTRDGAVTLQGVVRDDIQKDLAGAIAQSAEGVEGTTTATVKTALARGVKASDINVTTRWGTVTLAGSVATRAEMELASKTAEDVSGVKEVVNQIQVRG